VVLLGFARLTVDIDFLIPLEKRSHWLDFMREAGYRLVHGTEAFAQFSPTAVGCSPVDLMLVDGITWSRLYGEAREETVAGQHVRVPRVEHLVALKLHAATSPTRSAPEKDWEDIRQMVRAWHLNPADLYFREVILRHGGEVALARMLAFYNESRK